jgi:hypothetical protein
MYIHMHIYVCMYECMKITMKPIKTVRRGVVEGIRKSNIGGVNLKYIIYIYVNIITKPLCTINLC